MIRRWAQGPQIDAISTTTHHFTLYTLLPKNFNLKPRLMYVPKVRRARLLLHLRLIRLKAQRAENFCGIVTTCKNYYRFESHHIQSSFVPLFVSTSFNVSLNIYFWFCTMWCLFSWGFFMGFCIV